MYKHGEGVEMRCRRAQRQQPTKNGRRERATHMHALPPSLYCGTFSWRRYLWQEGGAYSRCVSWAPALLLFHLSCSLLAPPLGAHRYLPRVRGEGAECVLLLSCGGPVDMLRHVGRAQCNSRADDVRRSKPDAFGTRTAA